MRHYWVGFLFLIVSALAVCAALAQTQVQDTGWVDIGSTRETANLKRPVGSIYKGSGFLTYVGKPPKPFLQHDMGAYELDPPPTSDRSKPYNRRDFAGVWEKLAGPSSISPRIPKMTQRGWDILNTRITASGPRAYLAESMPQNQPELMCDPIGWPGMVYGTIRPVEMIHIPGRLLQHYAWHESWRTIWLDGRLLPKNPDPTWMGYTVGKWVSQPGLGDTLVADTVGVDERAWLDETGSVHSVDAQMQERWRRTDHSTLQFNFTLKDPDIYTEGVWEGTDVIFQLYPNLEVDHAPCVPSEELRYRENSPTETPTAGQKK
jgi:hypothetical protein